VSVSLQIEKTNGPARTGRLLTPHAEIETPVFMPVGTVASVKGVPQDILEDLGAQIILGNTYHLYLRPGIETVRRMGGLHGFMSWRRAILTDSGGFQVFSLSELRKINEDGVTFRSHLDGSSHFFSPESTMEAQIGLGADIIMAFDECTEYPADATRARASMEMTARWAARSKKYFEEHKQEVPWEAVSGFEFQVSSGTGSRNLKPETRDPDARATQSLFGIIQGGMDRALRKESAERTIEIGFPGYAIGGLSVGEPRELTREIVESTLEHLPADKPRYLMGVGTPEDIVEAAARGIDMFDCVLPTRNGRHGLAFTRFGPVTLKNARHADDPRPLDEESPCPAARNYSRAYLHHLVKANEMLGAILLTTVNLAYYQELTAGLRAAISAGRFDAFRAKVKEAWTRGDLPPR
jgi:queuine tRNA-ribosyltransferase